MPCSVLLSRHISASYKTEVATLNPPGTPRWKCQSNKRPRFSLLYKINSGEETAKSSNIAGQPTRLKGMDKKQEAMPVKFMRDHEDFRQYVPMGPQLNLDPGDVALPHSQTPSDTPMRPVWSTSAQGSTRTSSMQAMKTQPSQTPLNHS